MDKAFLIQLTNNLYKLTLLFPKKEPLRYKMRELADEILIRPDEKDLESLDRFFEIALIQNWVSQEVILALKAEYDKLGKELGMFAGQPESYPAEEETAGQQLPEAETNLPQEPKVLKVAPERKEKIVSFLKEKGRVQVWQIKQLFPEISKRTLRRYFESMTEEGVVERMGERNDTFYQLKVIEG